MDNIKVRPYKRRNYFIEKKFQSKFILRFCSLVLMAGLLTIGILYLLSMKSTTVAIINSRVAVRTTADFLLPILLQTVLIVTIMASLATIALTLSTSHKIAGPLYRFKKVIQSLETGDFSSDFRIRSQDQLQDLSEAFNSMIKKIREEQGRLKASFISLKEKLDNISEPEISEHKRSALNELKRICNELDKIIHYFKT